MLTNNLVTNILDPVSRLIQALIFLFFSCEEAFVPLLVAQLRNEVLVNDCIKFIEAIWFPARAGGAEQRLISKSSFNEPITDIALAWLNPQTAIKCQ